jgi:hypothetical protein
LEPRERLNRYHPPVIWLQGLLCLAVWIGYGAVQSRRSDEIRRRVTAMPRPARVVRAAALMFGGGGALLFGLLAIHALGGFQPDAMTPAGWLGATLVGLAFVHAQTHAMALVVSTVFEGVTASSPSTSASQDR